MTCIDYTVLLGTIVTIGVYGAWKTRHTRGLATYLKGSRSTGWGTIGLSVMATQASAITFLSTPGQGYESGMAFVQNYFGMPLALILVAAVFLPLYRKLNVYTAYEFLGERFDVKTRLLGAGLFLLQRGLAAGITIYAPAIIVSTVLGWNLDLTILLSGALVILYTVTGGSEAVSLTQKHQMTVILVGMATAFGILLAKMPDAHSFGELLSVAGAMGKLEAVDFSLDFDKRYTIWSGIFGGLFLSLSYFGTDQSQVQRYLAGGSLRASRLGLMFNAVFKIPMQFFILLLGALLFVFYQFERPPVFFNDAAWEAHAAGEHGEELRALEGRFQALHTKKRERIDAWLAVRDSGDAAAAGAARASMLAAQAEAGRIREETRETLLEADPRAKTTDSDFVFLTFILDYLPHGVIGLLLAVIFAASLSSTSAELNALGSTTAVDIYPVLMRKEGTEARYVAASKWFTALWGAVAIGFALFANLVENLIEAVNIIGSIFYGVVLGIFLVAFFLKRIGGTAVFWAAIAAQTIVLICKFSPGITIGYLWFNLIGCAATVILSLVLHAFLGPRDRAAPLPTT
ncbi:MAG: sodium:solute symporter [Opitutaceae bacterium]